jgi:hypothetical protein
VDKFVGRTPATGAEGQISASLLTRPVFADMFIILILRDNLLTAARCFEHRATGVWKC